MAEADVGTNNFEVESSRTWTDNTASSSNGHSKVVNAGNDIYTSSSEERGRSGTVNRKQVRNKRRCSSAGDGKMEAEALQIVVKTYTDETRALMENIKEDVKIFFQEEYKEKTNKELEELRKENAEIRKEISELRTLQHQHAELRTENDELKTQLQKKDEMVEILSRSLCVMIDYYDKKQRTPRLEKPFKKIAMAVLGMVKFKHAAKGKQEAEEDQESQ